MPLVQSGLKKQCANLQADRSLGNYWEREFCTMAYHRGICFTAHQWNNQSSASAWSKRCKHKPLTLPDVTLWSAPGQHHEIKHKEPNKHGSIGLEKYRLDALEWFFLETRQSVFYTLHRHDLAGGKHVKENNIDHWVTCDVSKLLDSGYKLYNGSSWVNGVEKRVPICYWPVGIFSPLSTVI